MKAITALESGLSGAIGLTMIHQVVKTLNPNAPRMDLLGMNALAKLLHLTKSKLPSKNNLYGWTLAGDIAGNAVFYSLASIARNKNVWVKGTLLGLGAGIGAVLLPEPMGLEPRFSNRTLETKLLTIGLYVAGGLIAAATTKLLERFRP